MANVRTRYSIKQGLARRKLEWPKPQTSAIRSTIQREAMSKSPKPQVSPAELHITDSLEAVQLDIEGEVSYAEALEAEYATNTINFFWSNDAQVLNDNSLSKVRLVKSGGLPADQRVKQLEDAGLLSTPETNVTRPAKQIDIGRATLPGNSRTAKSRSKSRKATASKKLPTTDADHETRISKIDKAAYANKPAMLHYGGVDFTFDSQSKHRMHEKHFVFEGLLVEAHTIFAPGALLKTSGPATVRAEFKQPPSHKPAVYTGKTFDDHVKKEGLSYDKETILLRHDVAKRTTSGLRAVDENSQVVEDDAKFGDQTVEILREHLQDGNDDWYDYELKLEDSEARDDGELNVDWLIWVRVKPQARPKAKCRATLLRKIHAKQKVDREVALIRASTFDNQLHIYGLHRQEGTSELDAKVDGND